MKERPILFNAQMVRALLDGSKTQTRRIMKPAPPSDVRDFSTFHNPKGDGLAHFGFDPDLRELQSWFAVCPYGQPGDRLWVRETWQAACGDKRAARIVESPRPDLGWIEYAATCEDPPPRWRPSIFMFRWASRITLEIVSVRVERLQDISRGDAMGEGCPFPNMAQGDDPRQWYADLWEQINGLGSWALNPWVWVVEFKRIEP